MEDKLKRRNKRFMCKKCNRIISSYTTHLENWHDEINCLKIRNLDWNDEQDRIFLEEYFKELSINTKLTDATFAQKVYRG